MKKVDSFDIYAVEEQFTPMTEEVMQGTVGGCSYVPSSYWPWSKDDWWGLIFR